MFRSRVISRLLPTRYCSLMQSTSSVKVDIPPPIKRGPTDLLQALANTVGVDPTAPHFALIDDPTTIPTRALHKETYLMAGEFGRRAARQLATEWPTLFMNNDRDEPRIEAFRPSKLPESGQLEATEHNLRLFVERKLVQSAIELYDRIRADQIKIPDALKLELFELVAYYNCENVPATENPDWPMLRNLAQESQSSWKPEAIANVLHSALSKNFPEAGSIMIAALCKYADSDSETVTQAEKIFKEMREAGQHPGLEAYTGLLATAATSAKLMEYLSEMAAGNIRLDSRSLTAAVTAAADNCDDMELARDLMAEGIRLDVPISLSTYSGIINANKDDREKLSVIAQVIQHLEQSEKLVAIESTDQQFFVDTMRFLCDHSNREWAKRLEAVYASEKNEIRLSFPYESRFYASYLLLLVDYLDSEGLLAIYISYVPRLVGMNRELFTKLSNRLLSMDIKSKADLQLLIRFNHDVIASGQYLRFYARVMRKMFLHVNVKSYGTDEREEYEAVVRKAVDAWLQLSRFAVSQSSFAYSLPLQPAAALDTAKLLGMIGDWPGAWYLIERLADYDGRPSQAFTPGKFVPQTETFEIGGGMPADETVEWLVDAAIERNDWLNATRCLQIVDRYGKPAMLKPLCEKIIAGCKLSPSQQRILNDFVRFRQ